MTDQTIIYFILFLIGLMFIYNMNNNENMRPVVYFSKGKPNGECGTAFVNMSRDHKLKEKLFKSCPNGYKCSNNTCIRGKNNTGVEEYIWQDYEVA